MYVVTKLSCMRVKIDTVTDRQRRGHLGKGHAYARAMHGHASALKSSEHTAKQGKHSPPLERHGSRHFTCQFLP